jgi:hypothetical protein
VAKASRVLVSLALCGIELYTLVPGSSLDDGAGPSLQVDISCRELAATT